MFCNLPRNDAEYVWQFLGDILQLPKNHETMCALSKKKNNNKGSISQKFEMWYKCKLYVSVIT